MTHALATADQLIAHAVGDYLLQSDWMATQKSRKLWIAVVHAWAYALPFVLLRPSTAALCFVVASHALIDRYRLARYVVWGKNLLRPGALQESLSTLKTDWQRCALSGYPPERPTWLAGWLLIIADNTLHVLCNALAFRCWP